MLNKKGFVVNNCLLCSRVGTWNYGPMRIERCDIRGMGEKNTCYKNKKYVRCPYFKYAPHKGDYEFRKYKDILFWEK